MLTHTKYDGPQYCRNAIRSFLTVAIRALTCWQEDAWRSSGLQKHHRDFQDYAEERISEWERQGKSVLPMTTYVNALERQRRTARVSG